MLTADLIRCRRRGKDILPVFVRGDSLRAIEDLGAEYLSLLREMRGSARDEVEARLALVDERRLDRKLTQGIRKLLLDRCEYETLTSHPPEELRRALFVKAHARYQALTLREHFDRQGVVDEAAADLGLSPEAVEKSMYADLKANEVMQTIPTFAAHEIAPFYNIALVQSMMLRSTGVTVSVCQEAPSAYRQLFRAARFHGLIYQVTNAPEEGYTIAVDGPFSLFGPMQRYGLSLAAFFRAVLRCSHWSLVASLIWGKTREPLNLALKSDPVFGTAEHHPAEPTPPELVEFCDRFRALGSSWEIAQNEEIFRMADGAMCIPDIVFKHQKRGARVYLETFGFWSRAAVWRRVEQLQKGKNIPLIIAISNKLRVSEEVLGEDETAAVYVYRTRMSPAAILLRVEQMGAALSSGVAQREPA